MMDQQKRRIFQYLDAMLMQRLEPDGHVGNQFMGVALYGQPDFSGRNQAHLGGILMVAGLRCLLDSGSRLETIDLEVGESNTPPLKTIVREWLGFGHFTMGRFGHGINSLGGS